MRGESATNGRTSYRLRFGAAAGGMGAVAIVAIMALSSVASAGVAPAAFKGAAWSPSVFKDISGCASVTGKTPSWSKFTGIGHMGGTAKAATCGASRGGNTFSSFGETSDTLTVQAPVHPPAGAGGVNVSWSIVMVATDSAVVTSTGPCPVTYSYSASYNYGYTWFNYSYMDSYCSVQSEVDLYGYSYIHNLSGGSNMYSSNYWYGAYNVSGQYYSSYSDMGNYSNSSYWAYNYSYSSTYNHTYGPSGTLSGTYTPTWFINGTFQRGAHYAVYTYIDAFVYASVQGYTGHAAASLNAGTTPNHVQLLKFSVW